MLRHRKMRHRPWWRSITKPIFDRQLWVPCRDTVAGGLAIGFFFSMILVLPLQMIFAAILAMRMRVNVPFAMSACWITNLFTNVPIGLAQTWIGHLLREKLGFPMPDFLVKVYFKIPEMGEVNAASFLLGMMVSAVFMAVIAFPMVHLFSKFMPHHLPVVKQRRLPQRLQA